MSENRKSEGRIVTLENSTAAVNMSAGSMVAVLTGTQEIYPCDRETAGLSSTANVGMHFVGILDDSVSALESPINIWTEGVFKIQLASSIATAAFVGMPVFACNSGCGTLIETSGATGDYPIGTVVGASAGGGTSGQYVQVKIYPGAYRWSIYGRANAIATADAVLELGSIWPPVI